MSTGPARCSNGLLDVELAKPNVALAMADVALA